MPRGGSRHSVLVSFLAEGMQDGSSADREAADGSESGDHHQVGAGVEKVGEDGAEGEDESQHIEPERRADAGADVFAKTKFEQESGESDGRHHDQRQRAEERGPAGVDHDQSEREQQESRGDDAPAAGLGRQIWLGLGRDRIGRGVRQGIPFQVIQGGARGFKSLPVADLARQSGQIDAEFLCWCSLRDMPFKHALAALQSFTSRSLAAPSG